MKHRLFLFLLSTTPCLSMCQKDKSASDVGAAAEPTAVVQSPTPQPSPAGTLAPVETPTQAPIPTATATSVPPPAPSATATSVPPPAPTAVATNVPPPVPTAVATNVPPPAPSATASSIPSCVNPNSSTPLQDLLNRADGATAWEQCLWELNVDVRGVQNQLLRQKLSQFFDSHPDLAQTQRRIKTTHHRIGPQPYLRITNQALHKAKATQLNQNVFHTEYRPSLGSLLNLARKLDLLANTIPGTDTGDLSSFSNTYWTTWDSDRANPTLPLETLLAPDRRHPRPTLPTELNSPWADSLFQVIDTRWPAQWHRICLNATACSSQMQWAGTTPDIQVKVHQFWEGNVWRMGLAQVWDKQALRLLADIDSFGNIRSLYRVEASDALSQNLSTIVQYDSNFEIIYTSTYAQHTPPFDSVSFLLSAPNAPLKHMGALGLCRDFTSQSLRTWTENGSLVRGPFPLQYDSGGRYLAGSLLGWHASFHPSQSNWRQGSPNSTRWVLFPAYPHETPSPLYESAYLNSAKRVWNGIQLAPLGKECASWEQLLPTLKSAAPEQKPALRVIDGDSIWSEYIHFEFHNGEDAPLENSETTCRARTFQQIAGTKKDILWVVHSLTASGEYNPTYPRRCATEVTKWADNVLSVMPISESTRAADDLPGDLDALTADVAAKIEATDDPLFATPATDPITEFKRQQWVNASARLRVSALAARLAHEFPLLSPAWIRWSVMGATREQASTRLLSRSGGWVDVSEEGYARLRNLAACAVDKQSAPSASATLQGCLVATFGQSEAEAAAKAKRIFQK